MTDPSVPTPPAERIVGARYRLGPVIGRGGMATVHRAVDIRLERDVAVKLLRPEVVKDADLAQRFRREALAATVLRHPNIVACLDTGTDGDQPYLVMELVDGEDLAARLRRGGRLATWQAARIGLDVARALGVAHVRGIVHRDIKPGNVLLAADGRALVTDFGIARLAMDAEAAMPGTTLGSVHYFSPEQARGATTTPASDVYGLGLVLFECLTGGRPWSGDTTEAIALARVGATAPSVRESRPEIPADFAAVVARALSPEPGDRYPNGAAMAAALEPILAAVDPTSPTAILATPAPTPTPTDAASTPVAAAPLAAAGGAVAGAGAAAVSAAIGAVGRTAAPPIALGRVGSNGPGPLAVAAIVAGVVLGVLAMVTLPGASSGIVADTGSPRATQRSEATPAPTPEPTPEATPAPTATATPEPTAEPTAVPPGEVADLCQTFFDLPCGLGAGRYAPSQFTPAFDLEIGGGWSTLAHGADVVVLAREEGLLTFMSGVAVVDPERSPTTTKGRPRDLIEAFVTMDGVASTEPADVRIDGRRGLSIDLRPVESDRLALVAGGESTFYLEPDRQTRVVALRVRDETVLLIIEPSDDADLRAILETADDAAGTIRWR